MLGLLSGISIDNVNSRRTDIYNRFLTKHSVPTSIAFGHTSIDLLEFLMKPLRGWEYLTKLPFIFPWRCLLGYVVGIYVVSQSTKFLYLVPHLLHSRVIHIQVKALSVSLISSSWSS